MYTPLTSLPLQLSLPSFKAPADLLCTDFDLDEMKDIQDKLLLKANALHHEHERQAIHHHVRDFAKGLLSKLEQLRTQGAPLQQIRQVGLDSLKELESSSNRMIQDFETFKVGSRNLEYRFSQFDARASAPATSPTWAAFSEPASTPFPHLIEKHTFKPESELKSDLAAVFGTVNKTARNNMNLIATRFGKSPIMELEKFLSVQLPDDCDSPWRYRAISAGVKHGITKALAFILPRGIQVKAAMHVSHVFAEMTDRISPHLAKMESGEEAHAWWKHQHDLLGDGDSYLESIQMAQGFVGLASIPHTCLMSIQHQLMDACAILSDRIGLTDANVAKIAYSTLQHVVENSPEALEERMWSQVIAELTSEKQ